MAETLLLFICLTVATGRLCTPDGGRVPFHAVAEVEMGEAPLRIQRFDRERAIRISAEVDKEQYEPEKITGDILDIELPEVLQQFPGYATA